jgi:hypothetical protein
MADRRVPFRHAALLRAALALGPLSGGAVAGVIVVDVSGAGDFTSLQAAIDAASEGDTILVRPPGTSGVGVIDGKSLTIVGDVAVGTTDKVDVEHLVIRELLAGQQVVARNLRLFPGGFGFPGGFTLTDNAGSIWIENCHGLGSQGNSVGDTVCSCYSNNPGGPGLDAANCASVTVVRSAILGGSGSDAYAFMVGPLGVATDAGPGVRAGDSSVALYESSVHGGNGGNGNLFGELGDGGDGIDAIASALFLSGCTLHAGWAGFGPPQATPGDAVHADAGSTVEVLDSSVVLSPGGQAFVTAPGTVSNHPGVARQFALPSPLREGEAGTLHVQGVQGDFVGFFWSFDSGSLPMPARNGWFVLSPSFIAGPFLLGAIADASGLWNLPIAGPSLPPASSAMTFMLQAYFAYTGGVTLSSGTAFTLVDAAF